MKVPSAIMMSRRVIVAFIAIMALFPVFSSAVAYDYDLAVYSSDIRFSADEFYAGDDVRIYAMVLNNGTQDLDGYVTFFQGLAQIGESKPVSATGQGQAEEVWVDWTAVKGSYNIRIRVSASDNADEDPSNNEAISAMLHVTDRPPPPPPAPEPEPEASSESEAEPDPVPQEEPLAQDEPGSDSEEDPGQADEKSDESEGSQEEPGESQEAGQETSLMDGADLLVSATQPFEQPQAPELPNAPRPNGFQIAVLAVSVLGLLGAAVGLYYIKP